VGPFLETLIGGLMSGMLYSLVALGFVLIFKASGVFNFAQGAMVLFAALAMARFSEWLPALLGTDSKVLGNVLAFIAAMALMIVVAWLIEHLVLGKLVNQEGITLLMATLGITYFLDGFGQTLFGSEIYKIDIGLPKDPMFLLERRLRRWPAGEQGRPLRSRHRRGAGDRAVGLLPVHLHRPRAACGGRRPPGGAEHRHPAVRIWVIVWSVAGFVALVAGVIWGSKLGVQFSLSLVALKALPVVILGGLTSVPGAIIGGLIIGVGEKLSEVFIGPCFGGGIEIWFGYVLVLFVLLVRPQGLFGEKIIDRV
jgi:branched-chain amino acid transport system permease protein